MTGAAQALLGWSLAAALAMVAATLALRTGRRRAAINEAMHELRRPLQALALFGSLPGERADAVESSTRLAANALEQLDRAVNGGADGAMRGPVRCEGVVRSAVGRWAARAALGGGSVEISWLAAGAAVECERAALEQAVDNLLVNAIEHGGPAILVEGRRRTGRLLISVLDSGRDSRPEGRRNSPAEVIFSRISGKRRRGHGLSVVRRVAAEHGGRFVLRQGGKGTAAVLELPIYSSTHAA